MCITSTYVSYLLLRGLFYRFEYELTNGTVAPLGVALGEAAYEFHAVGLKPFLVAQFAHQNVVLFIKRLSLFRKPVNLGPDGQGTHAFRFKGLGIHALLSGLGTAFMRQGRAYGGHGEAWLLSAGLRNFGSQMIYVGHVIDLCFEPKQGASHPGSPWHEVHGQKGHHAKQNSKQNLIHSFHNLSGPLFTYRRTRPISHWAYPNLKKELKMKSNLKYLLLLITLIFVPALAYAADPSVFIATLTSKVSGWTGIAIAGTILEFLFRLVPTQTPLSWAWIAANTVKALGGFFTAVAQALDKILPQNPASGPTPPKAS